MLRTDQLWLRLPGFVTCRAPNGGLELPVSTPAFVPSLRVCTLGTWGGRRGSQEGARKGPGAIGAKLRLALFGSCLGALGSAPSAPCCLRCLLSLLDSTSQFSFFLSLSQASFGSSSPGLFSFLTSSRGSQKEIDRLKGLLLKERILYTHRNISYFFPRHLDLREFQCNYFVRGRNSLLFSLCMF